MVLVLLKNASISPQENYLIMRFTMQVVFYRHNEKKREGFILSLSSYVAPIVSGKKPGD